MDSSATVTTTVRAPNGAYASGSPFWEVKIIGNWVLRGYQIAILVGVIAVLITAYYFWKKNKYDIKYLQIMIIFSLPFAVFFARIYSLISEQDPSAWKHFFIFQGISIYGVVIGVFIVILFFSWVWRHKIDLRTILGFLLPATLIGQCIGRWGNFTNHELYGLVTDGDKLNWLIPQIKEHMFIYTNGDPTTAAYREPLFLYEGFGTIIAYVIIVWCIENLNVVRPGVSGGLYLISYGIIRSILEVRRVDHPTVQINNTAIPVNLFLEIAIILVGLILVILWQVPKLSFEISMPWFKGKKLTLIRKKEYKKIEYQKEGKKFFLKKPLIRKVTKTITIYTLVNWPPQPPSMVKLSKSWQNFISSWWSGKEKKNDKSTKKETNDKKNISSKSQETKPEKNRNKTKTQSKKKG